MNYSWSFRVEFKTQFTLMNMRMLATFVVNHKFDISIIAKLQKLRGPRVMGGFSSCFGGRGLHCACSPCYGRRAALVECRSSKIKTIIYSV